VRPPRATLRVRNNRSTGTPRSEYYGIAPSESYCQIYCQMRGGEGAPRDREPQVFSNLLISICVSVGSNPTLSAIQRKRQTGTRRPLAFSAQEDRGCADVIPQIGGVGATQRLCVLPCMARGWIAVLRSWEVSNSQGSQDPPGKCGAEKWSKNWNPRICPIGMPFAGNRQQCVRQSRTKVTCRVYRVPGRGAKR
jgi:hypothetical protein